MLSVNRRLGPSLDTLVLDGASPLYREMLPVTEASHSEILSADWGLKCSVRRLFCFAFSLQLDRKDRKPEREWKDLQQC